MLVDRKVGEDIRSVCCVETVSEVIVCCIKKSRKDPKCICFYIENTRALRIPSLHMFSEQNPATSNTWSLQFLFAKKHVEYLLYTESTGGAG